MLIQIHGLPLKTKYHDVKLLIRSECTISEYQLDALAAEGDRCKKVLVTVGNEAEGLCLIKCLNGFHVSSEHCLRVEPVDMVKANTMDAPHQSTYEQRPGSNYTNQPRNVYPNQMAGDYNRGPQSYAPSGSHMSQRPVEPTGVRPEVWSSGSIPGDQWSHNQAVNVQGPPSSGFPGTPIYPQHPSMPQRAENNSYTDNRSQQSSNYGYTPKNNIPVAGHQQYRSHDPRSVEAADAMLNHIPSPSGRYPQSFQQEKPITIMKDNFQGPTMHQIGSGNPGSYQGPTVHGGNSSWNQGQQPKHQPYLKSNPAQYEKFYDDDRRHSQSGKRSEVVKPQDGARMAYKDYEKGRQFSPSRRIASDHAMPASMNVKKRVSPPVGHGPPTREPMSRRLASPERKIPSMGMAPRRPSPNRNMSPGHPGSPSVRWVPAARPATSPSARRISPSGRRASPSRRVSPSARRYSPGHRISPSGRRGSPSGRRGSPMARRMSPGRGAMSPGGRVSPSGRRISPSGRRPPPPERRASPGRRTSPHKHISPPGRRMSPTGRHMVDRRVSPRRMAMQKHNSPSRRLESPPPGQDPRQAPRYSPRRHHDKMADPKMEMDPSKNKLVRPAYESQASSQAMYSGGYRPNPKENVPYAMSSARQPDQRGSPWQQERDKNAYVALKKQDDDRRGVMEKHHAPRQSRSPLHRDRSPIKDRYRTNSPVSHSPRRSWALEKRPYGRSPEIREAPPPPIWPGKNPRDDDPYKNKYNRPDDPPKHPSVWDRPPITQEDKKRLEDVRRSGEDKRMGGGPSQRDMGPAGQYGQSQREPKFSSREYIDSRKEDYQRQRDMARRPSPGDSRKDVYPRQPGVPRRLSPDRREFREAPHSGHREERRHDEYRRQPSPRHQESKKTEFHKDFDKDFEDIYKRTQEFKKKAEQMRRSGDRRRDTHSEERHRDTSKEQYDRRRERSPQQRGEMERLPIESERRRYEEQKHKEREPEWRLPNMTRKNTFLPQEAKIKRDKAADEILEKILTKHKQFADLRGEQKRRATEEMKLALNRLFMDMFGQEDVSFIEIVIKYQTKISNKAEEAMVHDVLQCLTSQFRSSKRPGPEPDVPAKMARYSPEDSMKEGRVSHWSPVREKPYWAPRHEVDPRGMVEHRHKYEPPRPEPRPKTFPKAKVEAKPAQRNLTVVPTKGGPEEKPRVRAKPAEVKPKAVVEKKSSSHVVATVPPAAKEKDEKESKDSGPPKKAVEPAGPSLDSKTASTEGYYELSPLMSRMLNSELEDIMIKVWQELPDNPTNEAEKLVVNRLRNKADDDLRNVFGLNVSKRLLNVFNIMYIKMKFTSKPDGQELATFLKRNDISNFKWNNIKPLTYTAVVQNVKDFDYLCATQKFHIGDVKVLITPLYQFTKCPPKLRTSYHVTNFRSMNGPSNISDEKPETAKTTEQAKTTDTKPSTETIVKNPPPNATKETVKTVKATKETKEVAKDTNIKTSPKVVKKQTKITTEKKATAVKPISKGKQKVAAKKIETKVVKKEPVKKKIIDKKQKPLGRSILEAGNDFDELDDDEIMALVSQGIVLDECSGSDEEM